jgi:cytochrome c oxidase cbb3-type subunit 4
MHALIPMTLPVFRGLMTGILLVLFLWLIAWAWSKRRIPDFEAAARTPLEDEPAGREEPQP